MKLRQIIKNHFIRTIIQITSKKIKRNNKKNLLVLSIKFEGVGTRAETPLYLYSSHDKFIRTSFSVEEKT